MTVDVRLPCLLDFAAKLLRTAISYQSIKLPSTSNANRFLGIPVIDATGHIFTKKENIFEASSQKSSMPAE
jgi:hypothetical protein